MSLVLRLLLLIAAATAPVLVAQLVTQSELQQERAATERSAAIRLARLVSSDATRIIEGAKGILIAVSETDAIQNLDVPACSSFLARLAKRYPQIFNITLINDAGTPVCANTPSAPNATATDRFYFREAMRADDFVIGEYIVGRTIPDPQLPIALPFADSTGHRFVLSLGIDIRWLNQYFLELALPPGAAISITDRKGVVIVATSTPDLVGHPLPDELRAALSPTEGLFLRPGSDGLARVVSFEPLSVPPIGLTIIVEQPQGFASTANAASRRDLAITLTAILLTVAMAGIGTRYLVSRPLRTLTRAATAWGQGGFDTRVGLTDTSSEIGKLGRAFDHMADVIQGSQQALQQANETLEQRVTDRTEALSAANRQLEAEMAERQAAEAKLRQAQKMEAIGQLTGGIAHDFNNLLTSIGGSFEFVIKSTPNPDARATRFAAIGREAIQRAARMTHRLLAFARQQPLELQTVDVNRLVAGMSDLLRRTLGETVEMETVLAGGLWPTRTDAAQLESALLNLAINARDAMSQGGRLTIETANTFLDAAYTAAQSDVEPGQYVMLAVSDTGTGMSADTAFRAFDPFFTTKPIGAGTGLGLSMVHGFAKQSKGHVKIYSELGCGTTIKLYLPRTIPTDVTDTQPTPSATPFEARQSDAVLVVEDDNTVRELSAAFLLDLGYTAFIAESAVTALGLLRKHPEITVLFTDVVLGGKMSGRQLAEEACRERPDLRVLFTTGYTPNAIVHGGILDPGVHLLPKPFTAEALGKALRTVLDS